MEISKKNSLMNLAARYSGKLLLRHEIPLPNHTFQKLLKAGYFKAIPSIKKTSFTVRCQRCNNQKRSLMAKFPCPSCERPHYYCRKCIEMGRVSECQSLYYWAGESHQFPQLINACNWDGKLANHQIKAADRILEAIERNESELIVWGVCGAGKTEMLFLGIAKAISQGKRVCIATPRADVVRELLPRFESAFAAVSIQGLYGGSKDKDGSAQLIIATTHQLLRFYCTFDVMIIDEVDAFPFHADPSLPFATKRATKKKGTTIYLTATPRKHQKYLIKLNRLSHIYVPVRFHGHPLPVPTEKLCMTLKKHLQNDEPPPEFFTWFQNRNNQRRQLLVFVPTINLAEGMRRNIAKSLIKSGDIESFQLIQSVHAEDERREEKVEWFRKKKITILITTTILERGVTFPSVDVVVLDAGHEVFDEAALVQIAGRAGRSPSDPTGEVIFFHEGKTNAIVQAIRSIVLMNKRGGFNR